MRKILRKGAALKTGSRKRIQARAPFKPGHDLFYHVTILQSGLMTRVLEEERLSPTEP